MSSVIPTTRPERLVIRVGEASKAPTLEQVQPVIHSHPEVAGAVFHHRGNLMARQTIARANGRDAPVNDVIERSRVRNPDRAILAGQNACYCIISPILLLRKK